MEKHITKWLASGIISQEQAQLMLNDLREPNPLEDSLISSTASNPSSVSDKIEYIDKEKSSNKFITAISIIGAIFLGIGVIWLVGSNWDKMSALIKTVLLIGSTISMVSLGYYMGFYKRNFPIVGSALVLLATILFGASIFLIAQIYHVEAHAFTLFFIWLIGILPVAYLFGSGPVTALSCILFLSWFNSIVMADASSSDNYANAIFLNQIYGILLFGFGSLHYFVDKLSKVGRTYRLIGILLTLGTLFAYTFRASYMGMKEIISETHHLNIPFLIATLCIASGMLLLNLLKNPTKSLTNNLENGAAFAILIALVVFNVTVGMNISYLVFWGIFNVIFVALVVLLFKIGYSRMDMKLINIASMSTFVYIMVKFFDIFSNLLHSGITWIVFGIILLVGATLFEKKRRQIKREFKASLVAQS